MFLVLGLAWLFYAPDDLFIHLRFAANLATRGEWAFNPGHPVAGDSSPPWVLLLVATHALGIPLVGAAKGLGLLLGAAVVATAVVAARARGAPAGLALLAGLSIAASHWLTLWSAAGMETPLPALLLVAGVALLERGSPLVLGGVLALAAWSRPDAAPAAAVLLVSGLVLRSRRQRLPLALTALAAGLAGPLWSHLALGSWLPLTAAAKGAWTLAPGRLPGALLRTAAVASSELLPLLLLAALALLSDSEVRGLWRAWGPPLAAAATYPLGYAANRALGGVAASGRYLVPWFVLGAVGAAVLLAPWWTRHRRRVLIAAGLAVTQSLTLAVAHRPAVLRYDDYHRRSLLAAARWLHRNAPPSALVAAGDIGVVGFVGDVHVLDVAGIVNPDAIRWSRTGTTFEEVTARHPDYFINPAWTPGFDPARLDPVTARTIFTHTHEGYRFLVAPGHFTVKLRELDWGRRENAEDDGAQRSVRPPQTTAE